MTEPRSLESTSALLPGWLRSELMLGVLLLAAAGCSSGAPPTYPVSGVVRFPDGTPVKTGFVELYSSQQEVNARGEIQRDGSFELTTFQPNDGAVEGEHQVIVGQFLAAEWLPEIEHQHGDPVAPRFADYRTSELSATVRSDGPNKLELIVDRQPLR